MNVEHGLINVREKQERTLFYVYVLRLAIFISEFISFWKPDSAPVGISLRSFSPFLARCSDLPSFTSRRARLPPPLHTQFLRMIDG